MTEWQKQTTGDLLNEKPTNSIEADRHKNDGSVFLPNINTDLQFIRLGFATFVYCFFFSSDFPADFFCDFNKRFLFVCR